MGQVDCFLGLLVVLLLVFVLLLFGCVFMVDSEGYYMVKCGDMFYSIGCDFDQSLVNLCIWNCLCNLDDFEVGQCILVCLFVGVVVCIGVGQMLCVFVFFGVEIILCKNVGKFVVKLVFKL